MLYHYQALDSNGDTVSDYVDAPSESSARQKIKSKGLYVVRLTKHEVRASEEKTESTKKSTEKTNPIVEKIVDFWNIKTSKKQLGLFSRQLSTLLQAGMTLPVAINAIIEQIDNKYFKNVIIDVKDKLEEGSTFSNALRRHKLLFTDMYVNMVMVAENLGSLDQVMERLADMEEKRNILKGKVQAALYYPAFIMVFAVAVIIFLMVNVIPQITDMFKDQKKDLPLPTEIIIGLSDFLATFWFLIPIVLIGGAIFFKRYKETSEGKHKLDELKLKIPLIGSFYNKMLVQRFTQNLGVLLNNKVDIIKSFEIIQKIVDNVVIEERIAEATKKIKEGSSVSHALSKANFLPKLVLGMITAGEASDKLDSMLINIGKVYENEIDLNVTSLTSLIEPIIIVFMAMGIGMIVMAVMLPMMQMNLLVQ